MNLNVELKLKDNGSIYLYIGKLSFPEIKELVATMKQEEVIHNENTYRFNATYIEVTPVEEPEKLTYIIELVMALPHVR